MSGAETEALDRRQLRQAFRLPPTPAHHTTRPATCRARRQGADSKHQAGELKKRLDEALSSQRRLALQLGRAQAGGGAAAAAGRSLAALSANARRGAAGSPAAAAKPTCGKVALAAAEAEAEVEAAAAARRFAEQQEELVAARERCGRLEQQLRQLETLMHRRASELHTLQMRVAAGGGAEGGTCPASALPWGRGASGSPQPQRRSSDGSEGGDQSEVQWLRLKVLKGQSALDSLTNSNTRLLRDLERARAHIQELQWAAQEQAAGSAPWASTGQQPPRGRSADGLGSGGADGSAAATTVLQLRQELAAANHHAARLQIELDAATAKLEIYQAHHASQPPQSGLMAKQDSLPPSRTSPQKAGPRRHPSQAPQPRQQPRQQQEQCDVRVERVASWLRSHISQPSHSDAAVGSATSDATSKQREAPHLGSLPDRRNTCTGLWRRSLGVARPQQALASGVIMVSARFIAVQQCLPPPSPQKTWLSTRTWWSCTYMALSWMPSWRWAPASSASSLWTSGALSPSCLHWRRVSWTAMEHAEAACLSTELEGSR